MFFCLLRSRSLQIILFIGVYLLVDRWLPLWVDRALYAFSLSIKEMMLWLLPFTVSFFIASAVSSFEKKAPIFLFSLFAFEAFSNGASIWYSYGCAHLATTHLPTFISHDLGILHLEPLWQLGWKRPSWWSAGKGTLFGLSLGLCGAFVPFHFGGAIRRGKEISEWILTRVFARIIPLFVLGFVARMHKTKVLEKLVERYADLLIWLAGFMVVYVLILFWAGSGGKFNLFFRSLKNLLPAAGVALSTGCSLSTMPLTIEGTAKNLKKPELAKAIIPATTNIQQIGDCIANAFLCFLLYTHFYGSTPPLELWAPFSVVFVLARFATAAVLGGAIFIMIPIYENYLHFNSEMIALILAFNVILDPLITCVNVIANGALCQIFERIYGKLVPALHSKI